jgi:D-alanyl-D-alanine carboxypeptidase
VRAADLAQPAVMVTDLTTGTVLLEDNADVRHFPASLTKLMTLYVLFEALADGRVHLDQKFTVSPEAAAQPPTKVGLRPHSRITVEECIGSLITRSANDVAMVVAENLEGSEAAFAKKMTATATYLGMQQTIFYNPSGLPNPDQYTTARDLTLLSKALITRYPDYYHYFGVTSFRAAGKTLMTHNSFLGAYEGADGLKTGYTEAAGYNLAASVERHGHRLVGVVLGESSRRKRDAQMVRVMDQAFAQLGYERTPVRKAKTKSKVQVVQAHTKKHHRHHAHRAERDVASRVVHRRSASASKS